jgi:hypothetical protein
MGKRKMQALRMNQLSSGARIKTIPAARHQYTSALFQLQLIAWALQHKDQQSAQQIHSTAEYTTPQSIDTDTRPVKPV